MASVARRLGRARSSIRSHVVAAGFYRPTPAAEWSRLRLSRTEREEISRGVAAGESLRGIARRLGRASSTVSREVASNGGRQRYRAHVAHRGSRIRARRPKPAKLVCNRRLRAAVEEKLEAWWSPLQISGWLCDQYPGDEEMRVSARNDLPVVVYPGQRRPASRAFSVFTHRESDTAPATPTQVNQGPDPGQGDDLAIGLLRWRTGPCPVTGRVTC